MNPQKKVSNNSRREKAAPRQIDASEKLARKIETLIDEYAAGITSEIPPSEEQVLQMLDLLEQYADVQTYAPVVHRVALLGSLTSSAFCESLALPKETIKRAERIAFRIQSGLPDMPSETDLVLQEFGDAFGDEEGDGSWPSVGKVYQMRVELEALECWRTILVPDNASLSDLHDLIQAAMEWEDCHMYLFQIDRRIFDSEDHLVDCTTLADLLGPRKKKMRYVYDMGDSWTHTLTIEKRWDPEKAPALQGCVQGAGACPREDTGGVMTFLQDDPKQYEGLLGPPFDLKTVDARVRAVKMDFD